MKYLLSRVKGCWPWLSCAALLLMAAWIASACTRKSENTRAAKQEAERQPILVIGIDGFEWSMAAPLIAAGDMPHCAALIARGRAGKLETIEPTLSPVIWTSIVTSKNASEHGIHGFVRAGEGDAPHRLYDQRDRRCKALWSIFSDAGFRVRVIGWWLTWPVETLNGVMVAQTNTLEDEAIEGQLWKGRLRSDRTQQVYPAELQAAMLAISEDVEAQFDAHLQRQFGVVSADSESVGGRLWKNSRWSLLADEVYRRIALDLAAKDQQADLSLIYFGGADVLGHRFWRFAYPEGYQHAPSAAECAEWGGVIQNYYRYLDRAIGELVAAYPADTNFFLVSDHGMHGAFYEQTFAESKALAMLNSGAHSDAPPGVFIAAGPAIKPPSLALDPTQLRSSDLDHVAHIYDLTPTILELYDIPRARDMRGSILFGALEGGSARVGLAEEIPSHDLVPSAFPSTLDGSADPAEALRLEQLRAMGYLGGELDPAAAKQSQETPPGSRNEDRDGEKR